MSEKSIAILVTAIPTLILLAINPILAVILPVAVWVWWTFILPAQSAKNAEQLMKSNQKSQEDKN